MSVSPLPANEQLHYKPADHSWLSVDGSIPFYAQAVSPINGFQIPLFNQTVFTNNGDGNPTQIDYKKNGTTVATLVLTYDGSGYLTDITQTL